MTESKSSENFAGELNNMQTTGNSTDEQYDVSSKAESTASTGNASSLQCDGNIPESEPLPFGWEMSTAEDGRTYYLDHNTRTTTWTRPSPRDKLLVGDVHTSSDLSPENDLPAGFEMAETSDGKKYYVDHTTRTTSWVRPLKGVQETTRPLPAGWERRRTREGKLYFVDHNDRKTTWVPPWKPEDQEDSKAGTEVVSAAAEQRAGDTPSLDGGSHDDKTIMSSEEDGWIFVSKL
ncbi:MAG: hypothetical protein Q9191_002731 [Dirinaria sp. TL-2023a]